jgi:hypothetical protein
LAAFPKTWAVDPLAPSKSETDAMRVIAYETLLNEQVLPKCDIKSLKITGKTLADRQVMEVMYHNAKAALPDGLQMALMDSRGG